MCAAYTGGSEPLSNALITRENFGGRPNIRSFRFAVERSIRHLKRHLTFDITNVKGR